MKNGDLRGFEPDGNRDHRRSWRATIVNRRRSGSTRASALWGAAHGGSCGRWRRFCVSRRVSLAAMRKPSRVWSSTIVATTISCKSARRVIRNWNSGPRPRHAAPFERLTGKPLRIEVSGHTHAEQPSTTARVPGQAVRRRRDRRLRKDDAAGPAGEVAERRGPSRLRHRMELVRSGEGSDENRQEEKRAHPNDVQSVARDGLR